MLVDRERWVDGCKMQMQRDKQRRGSAMTSLKAGLLKGDEMKRQGVGVPGARMSC